MMKRTMTKKKKKKKRGLNRYSRQKVYEYQARDHIDKIGGVICIHLIVFRNEWLFVLVELSIIEIEKCSEEAVVWDRSSVSGLLLHCR